MMNFNNPRAMKLPVDSKGVAKTKILAKLAEWSIKGERAEIIADAILAILAREVERVIGEDERRMGNIFAPRFDADAEVRKSIRNQLRAEQRRKAGLV